MLFTDSRDEGVRESVKADIQGTYGEVCSVVIVGLAWETSCGNLTFRVENGCVRT